MTSQNVHANANKIKLLAICGSPRKGNTYKALTAIKDSFPRIEFEVLQLKDQEFNFCKGCLGVRPQVGSQMPH